MKRPLSAADAELVEAVDKELQAAAELFTAFPCRWVVGGGWAIDLFLDCAMRPHKDIDIVILRRDQLALQAFLTARGWTLRIAHDGLLTPWVPGHVIELPLHTIWCNRSLLAPDFIEVLLNEADERQFRFRRDTAIVRDYDRAFITAASGLPILAPEIALLYKANHPDHPDNAADFTNALPHLDDERRHWLRAGVRRLYSDHPWLVPLEHA
jgi:hypothetical protein